MGLPSWSLFPTDDFGPISALYGTDARNIVAVSRGVRGHFDGASWTRLPPPPTQSVSYLVAFGNQSDVWLGGMVPWSTYKAGGASPALDLWSAGTLQNDLAPVFSNHNYSVVLAGAGRAADDLWLGMTGLAHFDGSAWAYIDIGGSQGVKALWDSGQDVWAISVSGQILRNRR